jgi:hypothetical protein
MDYTEYYTFVNCNKLLIRVSKETRRQPPFLPRLFCPVRRESPCVSEGETSHFSPRRLIMLGVVVQVGGSVA